MTQLLSAHTQGARTNYKVFSSIPAAYLGHTPAPVSVVGPQRLMTGEVTQKAAAFGNDDEDDFDWTSIM
jgi:hypothetical protein